MCACGVVGAGDGSDKVDVGDGRFVGASDGAAVAFGHLFEQKAVTFKLLNSKDEDISNNAAFSFSFDFQDALSIISGTCAWLNATRRIPSATEPTIHACFPSS